MSYSVISVEHLSKQYDLGVIGTGTLSRDLNRWWARVRKQPDPYTRIGQQDAFARIGESILALDDVSFQVRQGEALGIIGRNGAGKSTLLKILSRVTAPTSGVVKVRGRIGSLLEVGTGFHPELTGRENVYLNGAILGMKKAEVTRKFDEIVDFAGVEKFIDTPVKRYSSGMYVRLAFAVAAHLDPEILIVDEVLAVGDAEFQKKCLGKMGDVASEGRTVLFVSHNMAAIQNLCKTSIILLNGKNSDPLDSQSAVEKYLKDFGNGNAENRVSDLTDAKRRIKHGPIVINKFYFEDDTGKPVQTMIAGTRVRLVLEYQVLETEIEINDVEVSIVIYDSLGARITNLWNVCANGEKFNGIPKSGKFVCIIDKNPFRTGEYKIDIWCAVNNSTSDWMELASSFYVEDGDYYGSGKLTESAKGVVLIDHHWRVEGE